MQPIIYRTAPFALALSAVILISRVHHPGAAPAHAQPLFQGAQIDDPTLLLFERSCQNCHSENTRWPWYSRIPPASWMIASDIRNARSHVNFSRWNSYSTVEQENLLTSIGAAARTGRMPLARYTFLHRESILTAEERQQIYRWASAERKRLRATGTGRQSSLTAAQRHGKGSS